MNKIYWFFIFISYSVYASDNSSPESFYYSGDFDKVIELYQDEIETGRASSLVYYNLATSYYRKAMRAHAALYYLKAYSYNPYDQALVENISFLLGDSIEPEKLFFEPLDFLLMRHYLGVEQRQLVFPASLIIFFLVLGLFSRRRIGSKFWPVVASFLVIYGATLSFTNPWPKMAVLAEQRVSFYSEPSAKVGVELFSLPLLSVVKVIDSRSEWVLVELPDERKAWVEKEKLALEG